MTVTVLSQEQAAELFNVIWGDNTGKKSAEKAIWGSSVPVVVVAEAPLVPSPKLPPPSAIVLIYK